MANHPVQIVLESSNFIEDWLRKGGGANRDFFEERDRDFVEHKARISEQLSLIEESLDASDFGNVGFVKVILNQEALAKSHRPTKAIFQPEYTPVVGGGDLGEIYLEVDIAAIERVRKRIQTAEEHTRYKENPDGKMVAAPSRMRSELGAIQGIEQYDVEDKRNFNLEDGLAWISNPRTGGAYIIELFETPIPIKDRDTISPGKRQLFSSFEKGLSQFGNGMVATRLVDSTTTAPMIGVRLELSDSLPKINTEIIRSELRPTKIAPKQLDINQERHAALLTFLDRHPLVKRILLPPIISKANSTQVSTGAIFSVPVPIPDKSYPLVGIVDGGVGSVLEDWVIAKHDFLSDVDKDEEHGTFIGGLVVAGKGINGSSICREVDGCKIVDLDLLPIDSAFHSYYNHRPLEFFRELRNAVGQLKEQTGVRIFNFSLNISEHTSSNGYSNAAKFLDHIAEEHDVIFVISAGNTAAADTRREWPKDPVDALAVIAGARNDGIRTPSESCRNLSVGALNPPNLVGIVPYAPSRYTCRGPGLRIGVKPDLAHIGGVGGSRTGLHSIHPTGHVVEGCGTSYAAPHVARLLATLDHEIEGYTSRETLMALAIHNASLPSALDHEELTPIVRDLVGFGVPQCSDQILNGSKNAITLVFANRIYSKKRMQFKFSWPDCLIKDGKCIGSAKLTLVCTPPFDYRFGAEFNRINIEASLRQEEPKPNGKMGFVGRLKPIYLPSQMGGRDLREKALIANSFKWATTKVYQGDFPKGVGKSTTWSVDVEHLAREGETLPPGGVPFTVMLTIYDPEGEQPVFQELRKTLKANGVKIADIQTAARILPRV